MIRRMMVAALTIAFVLSATEVSACHFFKKRGGHASAAPAAVPMAPVAGPCEGCTSGTIVGETIVDMGTGTVVTEGDKSSETPPMPEVKATAVTSAEQKMLDELVKAAPDQAKAIKEYFVAASTADRKKYYDETMADIKKSAPAEMTAAEQKMLDELVKAAPDQAKAIKEYFVAASTADRKKYYDDTMADLKK